MEWNWEGQMSIINKYLLTTEASMGRPTVKKQDIENSAIHLFATNGLAGTTVKDIANAAGVTEGALYRHYSGKNEMALELYDREANLFVGGIRAALDDKTKSLPQRFHEMITYIYDYYQNNPDKLFFVLLSRQNFPDQTKKGLSQNLNRDLMLTGYIEREMEIGAIEQDDPLLKMALVRGMILEPIMIHRYMSTDQWPSAFIEKVTAACLKVLGLRETNS